MIEVNSHIAMKDNHTNGLNVKWFAAFFIDSSIVDQSHINITKTTQENISQIIAQTINFRIICHPEGFDNALFSIIYLLVFKFFIASTTLSNLFLLFQI